MEMEISKPFMPKSSPRILKVLDNLLSPPPNFANLTYWDRARAYWRSIRTGRNVLSTLPRLTILLFMLGMSRLMFPLGWLLKKAGYRFIDIDLSQIGSIIYLDILLREDKLGGNTPRSKIFALASHFTDGNGYILNLYRSHVNFVRNPFLKFLLSPMFVSDVFGDNSYKYDSIYHTENRTHEIWNAYLNKFSRPVIAMPERDVEAAKKILSGKLPPDKPFVILHIRDTGFYKLSSQDTRNADIHSYQTALRHLIESDYAVIRLGDSSAADIKEMASSLGPMFFDYAHSDIKSEMMDAYLFAQCAFFIGTTSGPASIPPVFGKTSCNINWFNASTAPWFMPDDLVTIKKFRYKSDRSLVPFEKLFLPPFSLNPSTAQLDEIGVYLEDNTADEVYASVREFLGRQSGDVSKRQISAKKLLREENYSWQACGNFSETTLGLYEREGALKNIPE